MTKNQVFFAYFSTCMFEYEDEETFEQAFNAIRAKASKQSWLDGIYNTMCQCEVLIQTDIT
jgi:hypothetical protein